MFELTVLNLSMSQRRSPIGRNLKHVVTTHPYSRAGRNESTQADSIACAHIDFPTVTQLRTPHLENATIHSEVAIPMSIKSIHPSINQSINQINESRYATTDQSRVDNLSLGLSSKVILGCQAYNSG